MPAHLPDTKPLPLMRRKALRIAAILEGSLGVPERQKRLPTPLAMLVATILSQNTNDKNSHRAYTNLRSEFPRWEDLAQAPLRQIRSAIRTGGMARQKALRIKETLGAIYERSGRYSLSSLKKKTNDEIVEELTALNGVGVKTASCVLLFSLGRDAFPVDTHVHRLCNRLGLVHTRGPEQTYELMKKIVPKGKGYSFHTNLIRFGRRVCRSSSPVCGECPLFDECSYEGKERGKRRRASSSANHDFMLLDHVPAKR